VDAAVPHLLIKVTKQRVFITKKTKLAAVKPCLSPLLELLVLLLVTKIAVALQHELSDSPTIAAIWSHS
jgi:hypothetical protein